MNFIHRIVELVRKAQCIAAENGYPNLLQPGLVKEMVIADILGHVVSKEKHQPDAHDPNDEKIKYEYLSCFENGTFQFDRMFKEPPDKHKKSLDRIKRNAMIYCAIFERENPLTVLEIWEVKPSKMLKEAKCKLKRSKNDMSHIGFGRKWVREHGDRVYSKDS